MDDPIDRGLPFELGELWRPSAFSQNLDLQGSLFESVDSKLPFLSDLNAPAAHFEFNRDLWGVSELVDVAKSKLESLEITPAKKDHPNLPGTEFEKGSFLFNWNDDLKEDESPKFFTWEAFDQSDKIPKETPSYLSEAGPRAFDAAIGRLSSTEGRQKILPQDRTLRAMCNLTVGRSSTLFKWSESKSQFEKTVVGATVSGLTQLSCDSFTANLIDFGTSLVKLRRYVDASAPQNRSCATLLAFRSCLSSVLDAIDETVTAQLPHIKSLLQLQNLIDIPHHLIKTLHSLKDSVGASDSEDSVISSLSERISETVQIDIAFSDLLQTLLAKVSMPWIENLANDIGLCHSATGLTTENLPANNVDDGDDPGTPLRSTTNTIHQSNSLLSLPERNCVREVKVILTHFRQHLPSHPLITKPMWNTGRTLDYRAAEMVDLLGISEKVREYERQIVNAANLCQIEGLSILGLEIPKQTPTSNVSFELWAFSDEAAQHEYLSNLGAQMSKFENRSISSNQDELQASVLSTLQQGKALRHSDYNRPPAGNSPIDLALPLIKTQHKLANGFMLRHLFRDCKLQDHLNLQRSYHLFGNADFMIRLSKALFSSEAQSAERRRDTIPTGDIVGLRLGGSSAQRWPPASSELRLSLMDVLIETYYPQPTDQPDPLRDSKELPGGMSFAIRELPEEDIERVMDVQSIYALDFLKLQYTASAPLDQILDSSILQQYDSIFRYLLMLLRALNVTTTLQSQSLSDLGISRSDPVSKFTLEAHHVISVLTSHVMDIGISAPWHRFSRSLNHIERDMEDEDSAGEIGTKNTVGIAGLRKLHESCIERIRDRLFLRRKREKVRTAIEAVLSVVLKCSNCARTGESHEDEFGGNYSAFRESISRLCGLLQMIVNAPLKTAIAIEDDETESEICRILLLRLRWNGYY